MNARVLNLQSSAPAAVARAAESRRTEREHRLRLADERLLACLESGDPAGSPVLHFHGYPGSRLEGRLAAGLPLSEFRCVPDEGHLSLIVRRLDAVLADLCA